MLETEFSIVTQQSIIHMISICLEVLWQIHLVLVDLRNSKRMIFFLVADVCILCE